MQQTNCTKVLYACEVAVLVQGLKSASEKVDLIEVLSLSDMINAEIPVFYYNETFEDAINNPIVVLHSSGSTGLSSTPNLYFLLTNQI